MIEITEDLSLRIAMIEDARCRFLQHTGQNPSVINGSWEFFSCFLKYEPASYLEINGIEVRFDHRLNGLTCYARTDA